MRYLKVFILLAVFAVFGVGVTQAQTALDNGVPVFTDGRVNNYQLAEPGAVYCEFDHSQDVNVGVFTGIQVWGLNSNILLQATAQQIAAAKFSDKVPTVTLDSNNGYLLTEASNGEFTFSAPNGYNFSWARGDMFC